MDNEIEQHEKLIQLIREAIQEDSNLREKYQVGDKFRFVQDRLKALLAHLESQKQAAQTHEQNIKKQDDDTNKVIVYVYLYNAQGVILRSWMPMLTSKAFYEYSVNRPIYTEKKHVEHLIKGKANKQQHGYLAIRMDRNQIVVNPEVEVKDASGNPLIKVREGSLRPEHLVSFTHNDQDYKVNAQGEIVKKE